MIDEKATWNSFSGSLTKIEKDFQSSKNSSAVKKPQIVSKILDYLEFNFKKDKIALIVFSVLLAPVVEELVFRKAIYGLFEKKSIPLAIAISGLTFGYIHVLSGDYIQIIIYGS